jgi:GT2 family glycosyltransferase
VNSHAIDLSIIIVTHNARADVIRCLESLHDEPANTTHEIVVVDNASSDGTVDTIRTRWPGVQVVEMGDNIGFGAANNVGIRSTRGELILLLNGDTVVPSGALDQLVGELRRHADVAAIGPRIVDLEGRPELSFGRMVGPFAELSQRRLVRGHAGRDPAASARVEQMTRVQQDVDWISGACMLVRRRDAEAAGLFDERYFLYFEDVDFCAAIRRLGRRVLFFPSVEIVHVRGRSAASQPDAVNDAYRRSQLAFYRKHHPLWIPFLRLYLRFRGEGAMLS